MKNILSLLLIGMMVTSLHTEAKIHRSASAVAQFKRQNLCPSTGLPKGRCPGYIVDHIKPLCDGGLDDPINMQWQTVEQAKEKDRIERRICRVIY